MKIVSGPNLPVYLFHRYEPIARVFGHPKSRRVKENFIRNANALQPTDVVGDLSVILDSDLTMKNTSTESSIPACFICADSGDSSTMLLQTP